MNVIFDETKRREKPQFASAPAPRIRGVTADAATLGVHRGYLSAVLHGHISSKRLLQRYADLKALQAAAEFKKQKHRGIVRLLSEASLTRPKRPAPKNTAPTNTIAPPD